MMRPLLKIFTGLVLLALIFLAWLFYFLQQIGPGYADFSAELPHGYTLHRTSAHQITIWPGQGSDEKAEIIGAKVVELTHDNTWLLAKQQRLRRRNPHDPSDTYEQPEEGHYRYWIVNMATHERHGPLTEDSFEEQRKNLGISATLTLQSVYNYRP